MPTAGCVAPSRPFARMPWYRPQPCGSGLARDGIYAVIQTNRSACIAGKSALTEHNAQPIIASDALHS
ncbi:hypothetical protein EU514_10965 [Pseudomonas fragi]|nr:hypothetical protein [Pseudomonas fragi]